MMDSTAQERLEMRWVPVLDANGRARMEATWVSVPTSVAPTQPSVTHAA